MTLSELKDYIKSVCLAHKDIKDFYIGSSYNESQDINLSYPLVFYELPYYTTYLLNKQYDTVSFAFNVFVDSNSDKIKEDHDAISDAKEIGDAIIMYIIKDEPEFRIVDLSSISVREFGDDSVAGMRFELTIWLPRTYCESNIESENIFNPI